MNSHEQEERRARALSDHDIEAICLRLTEFSGLSTEQHREHHEAVAMFIERENRKAERYEKIKTQVGGWMIISILTAIGTAAWHGVQHFFSKGS